MAFDLKIEDDILCLTFHGRVKSEDLVRLADLATKYETEWAESPDRLSDLTSIEGVELDCAALEDFADRRRHAVLKNVVKSAIVVPRALQYGIARVFEVLNDNPRICLKIFTDRDRAWRWLTSGGGEAPPPNT